MKILHERLRELIRFIEHFLREHEEGVESPTPSDLSITVTKE